MATASNTKPKSAPAGVRAIVGVRVSAVGERDSDTATSAPDQRKWGKAEAARRGLAIVAFAEDLSIPGTWDAREERRGLWTAVEAIEAGEAEVIMFQNTKRFARDPELGFHVLRRIEAAGGWLVLGDCPDGAPKAMLGLMLGQGQDDHEEKKSYFATAKQTALENGVYLARQAPIGYQWNRDAGEARDPRKPGRALVKSRDADTVAELFRMRAAGAGPTALIEHLAAATGRVYWPQSIESLIGNRAYCGETHFDGTVILGTHPALVTEEEWVAAQRDKKRRVKRSGTKSLLAGIARCSSCGRKMVYDASGSAPTYKCPRAPRGSCAAPASIKAETLDAYVWSEAVRWAESSGVAGEPIELGLDDRIASARALVRESEEDLETWAEDSAGMPREAVQKGSRTRLARLQGRKDRLASLEASAEAASARVTFRELVAGTGSGLAAPLTTAERRLLLAGIIDHVRVTRGQRFHSLPVEERARIFWIED